MIWNRHLILFGVIIFLFFSACQPEDDLPPTSTAPCEFSWELTPSPADTCFQVPRDIQGTILAYNSDKYCQMPEYNPKDGSMVAIEAGELFPSGGGETEIRIVNLCTGENELFFSLDFGLNGNSRMQWGENGKIAFSQRGQLHILDVETNELVFWGQGAGAHSRPAWFFEGAQLYVLRKFEGQFYSLLLGGEDGTVEDTLVDPYLILPKERNGRIAAKRSPGEIGYLTISENDFTVLAQDLWTTLDLDWQDDEHILWTTHQGFFRVNTESAQVDTIRFTPCDNRKYFFFSVMPKEANHILVGRRDYRYDANDVLFTHREIVLIDLDTDEEWIVNFE